MSKDPPDFLFYPNGVSEADSKSFPNNPLLMPLDGSYVQQVLLNFQDTTSYLSNDNSKSFVGKVYGMCSMKEHNQKVQMNTANDLERDSDRNVNPKLTLKSFQRSDAFRTFKPEDVRPCFWCRRTVYYALCYFADCDVVKKPYLIDKSFTFLDIYNFLRDRMRSIWQDLTVQRSTRHRGYIECFEISIRFLIYSNEVLCENEEYEVAQNTLLLNTCLDKLMDGYSDVRATVNKVTPNENLNKMIKNDPNFTLVMNVLTFVSSHEPEFWSYRLLLLIPQLLTPGCSATFCDICQRMPEHIKNTDFVRLAISACLAATSGNIYLYFKLMNSNECHPLQAALMNRFAGCIRVRFLYNLVDNKIVKDSTNPLNFDTLKILLGYEQEPDEKMLSLLQKYEINTSRNDSYIPLETANRDMLAHDDALLSKTAGKTQITSSVVSKKFSGFKFRQLIFDPDFKAPFMSSDPQSVVPVHSGLGSTTTTYQPVDTTTTQPSTGLFGSTTTTTGTSGTGLFGSTTTQPSASNGLFGSTSNTCFGSTSTNVFTSSTNQGQLTTLATPSDSSYHRSDTFGASTTTTNFPTSTPNFNVGSGFQLQNPNQNLGVVGSFSGYGSSGNFNLVGQFSGTNYVSDLIRKYDSKKIKIFKPSLNYNSPDIHFKEVSIKHLKPLNDLSRQIMERLLNNNNDTSNNNMCRDNIYKNPYKEYKTQENNNKETKNTRKRRKDDKKEYVDSKETGENKMNKTKNQEKQQTNEDKTQEMYSLYDENVRYGFERFEYDRMPQELEMMKNDKNYVYLSINASLYYLEHELNRYFNSQMSKCILYSLYICNKCTRSKDGTDVLVKNMIKRFKVTKYGLVKLVKKLNQLFKRKKGKKEGFNGFKLRELRERVKKIFEMNIKSKLGLKTRSRSSNRTIVTRETTRTQRDNTRTRIKMMFKLMMKKMHSKLVLRNIRGNFRNNFDIIRGYLRDQLVDMYYRIRNKNVNLESNNTKDMNKNKTQINNNTYERDDKVTALNSLLRYTCDNIGLVVNNSYMELLRVSENNRYNEYRNQENNKDNYKLRNNTNKDKESRDKNKSQENNNTYDKRYDNDNRDEPNVWGSGVFVHVNFFDFNTNNNSSSGFGLERLGNGLLEFKEHVSDYMNSDYCLNLKLDILNMCGFRLNKQDLLYSNEKCSRMMFQVMNCEIPYMNYEEDNRDMNSKETEEKENNRDKNITQENNNTYKKKQTKQFSQVNLIPFSLNVSMKLRNESSLTRMKFVDSFDLKMDKMSNMYINNMMKVCNMNNNNDTSNNNMCKDNMYKNPYKEYDDCVYMGKIGKNDLRYNNQPQIAVFACSKTFKLGDDDFLYKMYTYKRSYNVLKFRDKLSLVDTLSLLSYVLNNKTMTKTIIKVRKENNTYNRTDREYLNKRKTNEGNETETKDKESRDKNKTQENNNTYERDEDEEIIEYETWNSSVCCLVCYRLSVSKLDILTLYRLSNRLDEYRCPHKSPNQVKKRLNTLLEVVNKALMDSLIEQANGFNLEDGEKMLRNSVRFACVGFEYEEDNTYEKIEDENKIKGDNQQDIRKEEKDTNKKKYKLDKENKTEPKDKENNKNKNTKENNTRTNKTQINNNTYEVDINEVLITRLLNPDGLRRGFSEVCELMLRGGRLRVLQRPVNLPDLRIFLVNLLLSDGVSYLEIERNLQGILCNSLQRFINNMILNYPESMWELYSNRYNRKDKIKQTKERKEDEMVIKYDMEINEEYSKNSFIAMLVNLKEHIKATQYTLSSLRRNKEKEKYINGSEELRKEVENKMVKEYLYRFFNKVLECYKIERFLVPYSVAYYMENLNLNK